MLPFFWKADYNILNWKNLKLGLGSKSLSSWLVQGTYGLSAHAYALVCKQMHIKVFEVCYFYLQTSLFWLWRFLGFNLVFACFMFSICHGVDVIPTLTYEVVFVYQNCSFWKGMYVTYVLSVLVDEKWLLTL
jgi:hypothetical protein